MRTTSNVSLDGQSSGGSGSAAAQGAGLRLTAGGRPIRDPIAECPILYRLGSAPRDPVVSRPRITAVLLLLLLLL